MSSIGQSILMALTVTVNKLASSNLQAVPRSSPNSDSEIGFGRRGLLFSTLLIATSQVPDSRTLLLQKYLNKSQQNKQKNDREMEVKFNIMVQRLESYYKRNYKDYFELVEGTLKGKEGQLSDTEKGILDWLKANK